MIKFGSWLFSAFIIGKLLLFCQKCKHVNFGDENKGERIYHMSVKKVLKEWPPGWGIFLRGVWWIWCLVFSLKLFCSEFSEFQTSWLGIPDTGREPGLNRDLPGTGVSRMTKADWKIFQIIFNPIFSSVKIKHISAYIIFSVNNPSFFLIHFFKGN